MPTGWLDTVIMYTDSSAQDAVRNGDSGVFARTQQDKQLSTQMLQAENAQISKTETSALQNEVGYITEMKQQKIVILTDSKAALESLISNTLDQPLHQLLKDLQLFPQECIVVLQ